MSYLIMADFKKFRPCSIQPGRKLKCFWGLYWNVLSFRVCSIPSLKWWVCKCACQFVLWNFKKTDGAINGCQVSEGTKCLSGSPRKSKMVRNLSCVILINSCVSALGRLLERSSWVFGHLKKSSIFSFLFRNQHMVGAKSPANGVDWFLGFRIC